MIELKRIRQATNSHCGPAVLAILLSFWGKRASQLRITEAGNFKQKIKRFGSKPIDLARAVRVISPEMRLWYKHDATLTDIETLVNEFGIPVAVGWQGLFREVDDEKAQLAAKLGYSGHYSVVSFIDLKEDKIGLTDPYKDFYLQDRLFSAKWFEGRWWDFNLINHRWKKQKKVIFWVTPKEIKGFAKMGMKYYK